MVPLRKIIMLILLLLNGYALVKFVIDFGKEVEERVAKQFPNLPKTDQSDFYTSISGLDQLIYVEGYLLSLMERVKSEEDNSADNSYIFYYVNIKNEYNEAKHDPCAYVANPVNAYKMIKRFNYDWKFIGAFIERNDMFAYDEFCYYMESGHIPSEVDLNGAVRGIQLLQETYNLKAHELAHGRYYGKKYSLPMTMSDCSTIALSLYKDGKVSESVPWFLISLDKIGSKASTTKADIARLTNFLHTVDSYPNDPTKALMFIREMIAAEPSSSEAMRYRGYFKKVLEKHEATGGKKKPKRPMRPVVQPYMQICRGELRQTPSELRPLRCFYATNGVPYRILHPFKVELLSVEPLIIFFHHVLSDTQVKAAIDEAAGDLERSIIGFVHNATVSNYRTSKQTWLRPDKHKFPSTIATVLRDVTGLSLWGAEALQVANYGIGGYYASHYDSGRNIGKNFHIIGDRIATALFYLNDVELGGATAFEMLNLAVHPEKGGLLFWYNLLSSMEGDERMLHLACPVLQGSKWILTEWFHEVGQIFKKPCTLNPDDQLPFNFS